MADKVVPVSAMKKTIINERKLEQLLSANMNVLFIGKHGVGKTSMCIEAFKKAGLKWAYFSGSTLDPWVDFVGIPQKVSDASGNDFIQMIPPKWTLEEVDVIMIDEFNRSHKKVRNAVMEAIQFKTINGKKLGNLRMVWAAINPDDDDVNKYDVERLDPAQKDRFQIWIEVPYEPSREYFAKKYGDELASIVTTWWKSIQSPDVKDVISPRRLDYAMEAYMHHNLSLHDILPMSANVDELVGKINSTGSIKEIKQIIDSKDKKKAKEFIEDVEKFNQCKAYLLSKEERWSFFLEFFPDDEISNLLHTDSRILNWAVSTGHKEQKIYNILVEIHKAKTNNDVTKKIERFLENKKNQAASNAISSKSVNSSAKMLDAKGDSKTYLTVLSEVESEDLGSIVERKKAYNKLVKNATKDMGEKEAEKTLKIIDSLVNNSTESTLESNYENILEFINLAVCKLHNSGKIDDSFDKQYPAISKYAFSKPEFFFAGK